MRSFICDSNKCISGFQKIGSPGELILKWGRKDSGISKFLLVFAAKRATVNMKDNYELQGYIDANYDSLLRDDVISNEKWTVRIVSFGEVFSGNVHIPDLPGWYAVYSIEDENIYYEAFPIFVSVSVRLEFSVEKHMNEIRHLFKKNEFTYSGYKKITLHNGIKGIAPNVVRYRWGDGRHSIPVPKSILETGDSFFVMLDENERVDIYSLYDGIEISRREN